MISQVPDPPAYPNPGGFWGHFSAKLLQEDIYGDTNVTEMNKDLYNSQINDRIEPWIVQFYKPNDDASREAKEEYDFLNVASVNCRQQRDVCSKASINEFPAFRWFGEDKDDWQRCRAAAGGPQGNDIAHLCNGPFNRGLETKLAVLARLTSGIHGRCRCHSVAVQICRDDECGMQLYDIEEVCVSLLFCDIRYPCVVSRESIHRAATVAKSTSEKAIQARKKKTEISQTGCTGKGPDGQTY
eukprot:s1103_g7.t1